ncbi:GxxExxY protein [Marispirochaeta aestuarii]|uniref:GxxExxY protein n=1 Tax=Marispirochaeta aestuarii TaxID=1963862 RepID=A0A1Y1RXS3_9SPIO|nr:GxxExxY protein [Marispirochaeta aestuarii]ORC34620.1 GxxExxY protein [Marispirochaeta aestuarii]
METDQITELIIGASFEVMNELGAGFLEKVYENALLAELKEHSIFAEQQKEICVWYKNNRVGTYLADLVVENSVIVELKAVNKLDAVHSAQLINYLRASDFETGLLINFGNPRVEIKRLFNKISSRE